MQTAASGGQTHEAICEGGVSWFVAGGIFVAGWIACWWSRKPPVRAAIPGRRSPH